MVDVDNEPRKKGGWKDTSVVPTTGYLIPNLVNIFLEKKYTILYRILLTDALTSMVKEY